MTTETTNTLADALDAPDVVCERCPHCAAELDVAIDAPSAFIGRNMDPLRVTDYDANGEAIDRDVEGFSGLTQGELPGMPEAVRPLWPRIDGHLVGKVRLAISGTVELDGGDESLAIALALGESVRLIVECNIDGKSFTLIRQKGHRVGLMGTANLKVVAAELAEAGEFESYR